MTLAHLQLQYACSSSSSRYVLSTRACQYIFTCNMQHWFSCLKLHWGQRPESGCQSCPTTYIFIVSRGFSCCRAEVAGE